MEAMKVAVEQGKVRAVGLSEASPAKIREANEIFPVKYIQQEWSLLTRNLEEGVVPTCAELGITIVAYSPLARNLLTGVVTVQPTDFRASQPRYAALPPGASKELKALLKPFEACAGGLHSTTVSEVAKWHHSM
mmetsp:Transcript_12718/g.46517  ORF Transcript_12718/g.46517 Transcript_12718/m.46517 type:complete len:134 (+) Transcript_12718:716-1117(+)